MSPGAGGIVISALPTKITVHLHRWSTGERLYPVVTRRFEIRDSLTGTGWDVFKHSDRIEKLSSLSKLLFTRTSITGCFLNDMDWYRVRDVSYLS